VLIYAAEREVFRHFCAERRASFVAALADAVSQVGSSRNMTQGHPLPPFARDANGIAIPGLNRGLLNARLSDYSACKKFVDGRHPRPIATGALGREFGRHLVEIAAKYGDSYRLYSAKHALAMTFMWGAVEPMVEPIGEMVWRYFDEDCSADPLTSD